MRDVILAPSLAAGRQFARAHADTLDLTAPVLVVTPRTIYRQPLPSLRHVYVLAIDLGEHRDVLAMLRFGLVKARPHRPAVLRYWTGDTDARKPWEAI